MESNFIKERVVIREELIKKNLNSDKKKSPIFKPLPSKSALEKPPERVVVFEELVNEGLKQELVVVSQKVDTICQTIADYLKIRSALKIFKVNSHDVRVQTNIGCNFYAQCHIDDASKIYLCVGQDYYLYLDLDEALKMIDFKEKQLMKLLDDLQQKASRIKAYIKIALETMGRLYELDRDKLSDS